MPVLLTAAFDPGDLDPGQTYPRAKITQFTINTEEKYISFHLQYGNESGGVWTRGNASSDPTFTIQNNPAEPDPPGASTDYDDIIDEVTTEGEGHVIYAGAKRVLYQWLIDNGYLAGTIE